LSKTGGSSDKRIKKNIIECLICNKGKGYIRFSFREEEAKGSPFSHALIAVGLWLEVYLSVRESG
jgi:hypothetical protein